MKTYHILWDKMGEELNIERCIMKASLGKKKRTSVKRVLKDKEKYVDIIYDYIHDFRNAPHTPVKIIDGSSGKEREIIVPTFKEQIVHHMIVNALMPMFTKGMYKHTYSSIPGRGLHKCAHKITTWIQNDPKNVKYCLKLDIKKFFNSIDHKVLIRRLEERVKDKKMMKLIKIVLSVSDKGIPLGFYTSHWFANWLLQPLDHYIKEELHVKHYARYMDDMVIFGSNKKKLHKVKDAIEEYLRLMNLELKGNWQVFRFDYIKKGKHKGRDLDFIGFRFYRDKTVLRKKLMYRMTKAARKINKKGKFTVYDARKMMSYLGWVDWADCYNVYTTYVAPYVKFKTCRKKISEYDKAIKEIEKQLNLKEVA